MPRGRRAILRIASALLVAVAASGCDSSSDPADGRDTTGARSYGRIAITSVGYTSPDVEVEGTADLPSGAVLTVEMNSLGTITAPHRPAAVDVPTDDGHFLASLRPPNRPEFRVDDRFLVHVVFKLHRQPDDVLALVGEEGENLARKHVIAETQVDSRWSFILAERKAMLRLAPTDVDVPFDAASSFRAGSAERFFASFMEAWRERRWAEIASLVRGPLRQPPDFYRRSLASKGLRGFQIVDVTGEHEDYVEIKFRLWYETRLGPESEKHEMTMDVSRVTHFGSTRPGPWTLDPLDLMLMAP